MGEEIPRIEYCFFMPGSSATLFRNFLQILAFDALHTKGSYKGMIFMATAITGDSKKAIQAYAIVTAECYKYWRLFVHKLREGLNLSLVDKLVIINYREKGLIQAVRGEVANANH